MFEYKGYIVSISSINTGSNLIEHVWIASRGISVKSGKAGSYESAKDSAKAAIDTSGIQPLYG